MKGLGTWSKEDLQDVIQKSGGLDSLLVAFDKTDNSEESLSTWMKNNRADDRKEKLYGKQFNISKV